MLFGWRVASSNRLRSVIAVSVGTKHNLRLSVSQLSVLTASARKVRHSATSVGARAAEEATKGDQVCTTDLRASSRIGRS
jgi:hypothetical protein